MRNGCSNPRYDRGGRQWARLTALAMAAMLGLAGCAEPGSSPGDGPGAPPPAGGWDGTYRGVDELVAGSAANCVAGGATTIVLLVRGSDARFEISSAEGGAAIGVNALGVITPDGTIRSVTMRVPVNDRYGTIEFSGRFRGAAFVGESSSSPSGCRRKLSLAKV